MKIAIVYDLIYPYSIGGIEKRNWEIARRLVQKGHSVTLFGTKTWQGSKVIVAEGVEIHGVGHRRELYVNGHRSISEPILFSLELVFQMVRERFDVIEVANFPYFPCFSCKLASMVYGSPIVITWHEVFNGLWTEYLGWLGPLGKAVEKVTSKLSRKVISVSGGTRDALKQYYTANPIEVIPNGVDFDKIAKVSKHTTKCDIIFAGRLIKEKNLDLLINAIGVLRQSMPNVACLIIGDGPEKGYLVNLVNELRLDSNIRFEPFLEDPAVLYSFMKSSKVFVLPSIREGFGIIVLEANACGLPVITTNHPRNEARMLVNEGNGFIAEAEPKQLAHFIKIALATDMRNSSIEYSKKYSWDNSAEKIESFFFRCLSN